MRRALVTGGSSGIGLAIAKTLAAAGHHVTIAARDRAKLEASGFAFVDMDVTDTASIAAGLKRAGEIDIFIANAGTAKTAPVLKTTRAVWNDMLALNLTSVFDCAQAALPGMLARGWGRFVVVGSTASLKGYPNASAYAAAKHGAVGFVRSLALELAGTGVTANAVCPGYVATPMLDRAVDAIAARVGCSREEAAARFAQQNPSGKLITPAEVATEVLALCAEDAKANGEAVLVDGSGA